MQVNTTNIESASDLVSRVVRDPKLNTPTIFRGQSRDHSLLPSISRRNPKKDSVFDEKILLEQLRLMGHQFDLTEISDWDLLIKAQHYGLKTRLLDWTDNPLVALYFACAASNSEDGVVYSLETKGLVIENFKTKSPFKMSRTAVLQPTFNNERIVAQSGWFTCHRYSKKSQGFVSLDKNPEMNHRLQKYVVKAENKLTIKSHLDQLAINERTLFPDLNGLCQYLNWKCLSQNGVQNENK